MATSNKTKKKVRKNKYSYYKVLQGNYGYGWEDLVFYQCNSTGWIEDKDTRMELKSDKKAYRENEPGTPLRVIFRKEKN